MLVEKVDMTYSWQNLETTVSALCERKTYFEDMFYIISRFHRKNCVAMEARTLLSCYSEGMFFAYRISRSLGLYL